MNLHCLLYYEYHKQNSLFRFQSYLTLNSTLKENVVNKHVKNQTILNAEITVLIS